MKAKKREEQVYDYLQEQIQKRNLLPGMKIVEEELAENLGLSRSPIRRAIKRLGDEGYLRLEPNKGAYVEERSLSPAEYVERLEMIELLLTHYLFQVEGKHIKLPLVALTEQLAAIEKGLADNQLEQVVNLEITLMASLLSGQRNHYYQQIIIENTTQLLATSRRVVPLKRKEIVTQYYQCLKAVIHFILEKDYPKGRREIRVFINSLTLAIIDRQELDGKNKYEK